MSPQPGGPKKAAAPDEFSIEIPEDLGSDQIPAGDNYIGKLVNVTKAIAKSSGNPMWVWDFVIVKGPYAGKDFTLHTSLSLKAMWKMAQTLEGLGFAIQPGVKVMFNKREAIGRLCRLVVRDDTYNNRPTSKLDSVLPHPKGAGYKPSGAPGNAFVEAAEAVGRKAKKAAMEELEEEEEEELEEEVAEDEAAEEELDEDFAEDEDEVEDEAEDEDDEGEAEEEPEDEEEEDEAPPPKLKKKAAAPPPPPARKTRL
jgi:hypothetical protein